MTAWERTEGSGAWLSRFALCIRPGQTSVVGQKACSHGRRDWDYRNRFMAILKPWYKVVTPREDLRESKPLDASEFAVHLDQVRDGRAPAVYRLPEEFFDRTYVTRTLLDLASQSVRRLSGEKTET